MGALTAVTEAVLLQTDVVDSTRVNEVLGDTATAVLWQAHDRLARDLLQVWRGLEIDKSDGFLLLFETAADAVSFALSYHEALASLQPPLQARAGLHVGPLMLRSNPSEDIARGAKPIDVEGLTKPTTARIMSVARGGQTLMSDAARRALGQTVQRQLSHGHWRIKGLYEPLELFEIGNADGPFMAPPDGDKVYRVLRHGDHWLPLRELRHTLPAERDAFVGRHTALQDLAQRALRGERLITVLGPGGIGKTRLACRFAWSWLGDFAGGAWFCDLAAARELDGLLQAVAQGLALTLNAGDATVQIGHALAGRGPCLLILDNFEQLSRHAEATVGQWLARAPQLHIIVTTREVLGIAGEAVLALAPLTPGDAHSLFLQRAVAADAGFTPNADDQAAITPLVQLLDGLPLAIELAAARVPVMPPRALLARMDDRFRLLASTGQRRDRQATLRATLDWSWELLAPFERAALAQLSVFDGGFSLAAAEQVLDLAACGSAPWVVNVVQALLQKSLLRAVANDRFDQLVSVREYAAQHLAAPDRFPRSGPQALADAQARHWRYFAGLTEAQAGAGAGMEIDNLCSACRRATAHGASAEAIRALAGAWAALRLRGPCRAALPLAEQARSLPALNAGQRATLEWVAGCAADAAGLPEVARASFHRGLQHAEVAADAPRLVHLLCALGEQLTTEGKVSEAKAHLDRALLLAQQTSDALLECKALNALGALANDLGRMTEARQHFETAVARARAVQDRRWEGGLLGNLGGLDFALGELTQASGHYAQAMHLACSTGDRLWEGNARCNLGVVQQMLGEHDEALQQYGLALRIAKEMGHRRLECLVECNLGIATEALGRAEPAVAHHERALAIAQSLGDKRTEAQIRGYLGLLQARQGRTGEGLALLHEGERLLLAQGDAASLALLLCGLAEAQCIRGAVSSAHAVLARASALAAQVGCSDESELGRALCRSRRLMAQQGLGADPPQCGVGVGAAAPTSGISSC